MATVEEVIGILVNMIQAGQDKKAAVACRQVLDQVPDQPDVLHLLGVIDQRGGDHDAALVWLRKAIAAAPDEARFQMTLGLSYKALDRLPEAVEAYQAAVRLDPTFAECWANLANTYYDLYQIGDAIDAGRQAVQQQPRLAAGHLNLANALKAAGQVPDAIEHYRKALELRPTDALTMTNLAGAYFITQDFNRATQLYRKALKRQPSLTRAMVGLGDVLRRTGHIDEAASLYEDATKQDPDSIEALTGLAAVHRDEGAASEAVHMLRRACRLAPNDAHVGEELLLTLNYLPDAEPTDVYAEHLRWGQQAAPVVPPVRVVQHGDTQRRLRMAFVSPDFRKHAVACFALPLIEHLDRERVELLAYAEVLHGDGMTARFRQSFDHWIDTPALSDDALAARIESDGIDVLIDLAGHMPGNRLRALAMRPAPVQITYLGYPNTTGLAAFDYRLTDVIADPQGHTTPHIETLINLPTGVSCYMPLPGSPQINDLPAKANGYVTFGTLSNPAKINDRVVALWAQVLHAVAGSKLRLVRQNMHGRLRDRLTEQFTRHDVAPDRLAFVAPPGNAENYLAAYHEIDISLDTFPYSGHTTTCESLWMGVPVLTLTGRTTASRMSASVLHQVGLPQLAHATEQAYVESAILAAGDIAALAHLRGSLREHMLGRPLCQYDAFAAHFESVCRSLWQRACESPARQSA